MKYLLSAILLFGTSFAFATEYRVRDGKVDFAIAKVVVNGDISFFWNQTKADDLYNQAVLVGTNTVTHSNPTPSIDEINLSTCGYKWRSWEDFKQGKKGVLKWQIKKLQDDEDDDIVDAPARIDWLRDYRSRQ
jgi:hypothetical protein